MLTRRDSMRGSRKFCQRGSKLNSENVLIDNGLERFQLSLKVVAIISPLAKRHLNGVLLVCR